MLILEHLQSIDSSTSTSREVSGDNVQKCLRFAEESGLYDAGDDMQQNLDSDMTEQLVDSTQSTNLEETRRQTYAGVISDGSAFQNALNRTSNSEIPYTPFIRRKLKLLIQIAMLI